MTEAEAIKWIDDRMCYGRYTPQKHNQFVHDECCQAGELAIKALEKQIAKKIVINNIPKTSWTKATTKYTCPSCDRVIGFNGMNYCPTCGQKLDWSEV